MDFNRQITSTYRALRLGLAALALSYPLVLSVGAWLLVHLPLARSLSEYYHVFDPARLEYGKGVMRDAFVGLLFAQAALLYAYKGYTKLEDWALNLAAVMAVGIAIFPMAWPDPDGGFSVSLHGGCAALFFVGIAYVCIFRAQDTLSLVADEKRRKRYRFIYRLQGLAMLLLPLVIMLIYSFSTRNNSAIFWIELSSIYTFASYWLVKSHEAQSSQLEQKAAAGQLQVPAHNLRDSFRPLPVMERLRSDKNPANSQ
jgi:hypothetical protein